MIELLCLISDEKEDKIIKPLYDKYNMPFNLATHGEGTASSSILEYFGLEEVKKYIYFSLINEENKKEILKDIKKNFELDKPGNGICFTLPLSSSTKYIQDKFKNSKEESMKNNEIKNETTKNKEYHLIVTIVTEGYSETVMNTAKKAGAGGGTLLRGRSLFQKNSKRQFLGFSIEPEKDVVLIVADKKIKNDIMNAIVKETGLKTKGGGIIFSLPISEAIGLFE
ncbi:MAG: P-II family nitrogen regulator [Bacilli bacterium]